YIIGILGSLFAAESVIDLQPLEAFLGMIPYNFYAIGALLLVFLTAFMNINIGSMRKHENRAVQTGEVVTPGEKIPGDLSETFTPNKNGRVYHLIAPILVLVFVTIGMMILTGIQASMEVSLLKIFANTNVNISLFTGGLLAVLLSLYF